MCSWCAVGFFELCRCISVKSEDWKSAPEKPLQLPPARIHRTLPTTRLLEIDLRNHSNYPPRIHRTLPTNPPLGNRPEKPLQLPPLEFIERYRQPPLGNRPEKPLQLPPPRIHRTLPTTPNLCYLEKILRITPAATWLNLERLRVSLADARITQLSWSRRTF